MEYDTDQCHSNSLWCVRVCVFPYNTLCKLFSIGLCSMCIEYHVHISMYYVSAQGVDERVINVHY